MVLVFFRMKLVLKWKIWYHVKHFHPWIPNTVAGKNRKQEYCVMLLRNTKAQIDGMYCILKQEGDDTWEPKTFSWIVFSFVIGLLEKFRKMHRKRKKKNQFSKLRFLAFFRIKNKIFQKLSKFYPLYCTSLFIYKIDVTATIIWACSWAKLLCVTLFEEYMLLLHLKATRCSCSKQTVRLLQLRRWFGIYVTNRLITYNLITVWSNLYADNYHDYSSKTNCNCFRYKHQRLNRWFFKCES